MIKGGAKIKSNILLRTLGEGNDGFTQLLLHFDGADGQTTFIDVSQNTFTVTRDGSAQVDIEQSKFGGGSMLCDGTGDGVSVADHAKLRPGTGDFTIDFWVRIAVITAGDWFFSKGVAAAGDYGFDLEDLGAGPRFTVLFSGAIVLSDTTAISTNTWYHIAVVRSGTALALYRDGISVDTGTSSDNLNGTNTLTIGHQSGIAADLEGWLDEFRYSNIARWTTNFTPPTREYSN